jgi:linoleoyl-CoA desaturase
MTVTTVRTLQELGEQIYGWNHLCTEETYTTGKYNNVLHHTYTNIPGHDKDLDAGTNHHFTVFNNITVFCMVLITFNWAITTDFKQMKSYLKRKLSYGEAKSQKHFGQH